MKNLLFFLALLCITLGSQAQEITIIHAGTLLATPGEKPLTQQTIIIENGTITKVSKGYITATQAGYADENVKIIDKKNSFVMPGFIDLHTHITGERDPDANPYEWVKWEEADAAYRAIPYAERTLHAGFTTIRNLGGDANVMNALKRAVGQGFVDGPRIFASTGAVSVTGGHGDSHGYNSDIMEMIGVDASICDGPDDCRRAVRDMVKRGADVIKITATGGVLSNTAAGVGQQFTDEELEAIVETATSMGRNVAAHAHEADGINAALRAGVQTIDHGSYADDESVRLFNQTGAYLVPTLLAGVSVKEELAVNKKIPPAIAEKIRQVAPVVEASFKRALNGGVKIAFGTDSGVSKHGANAREFEIMVQYGMDENQAIKSATITAAEVLGMSSKLGTIEKGKIADLVAVEGNPLENISLLKDISFVMKEGKVYKE